VILACLVQIRPLGLPANPAGFTSVAIIKANIVRAAPVGILVQRIVGRRFVRVGKVPFGLQGTGRIQIRWDLRVGGHRLQAGRYLITLRMFDRHHNLIALARPIAITIAAA
jgi:hypothetical protein